ncbi:transposase [Streptomyces sp. NPDC058683]|uniref:transposase n=1 Tax=Streptomyces sp. NPDC058683 TaxID=3346597 RepID=UPI003654B162
MFPAARHQRCWVHKARNITNCLPKSAQPGATKALAMVFKLVESAQVRRRAITGAHLVSLVRAGARFGNGVLVERPEAPKSGRPVSRRDRRCSSAAGR